MAHACIRCGKPGPHYVPPSLGDEGFFLCDPAKVSPTMVEYEPGWQSFSHWGMYQVYPVRIFT